MIPHDYVALILLEQRAARLREEATGERLRRVVRTTRSQRRRRAPAPVVPLQRAPDRLPRVPADPDAGVGEPDRRAS